LRAPAKLWIDVEAFEAAADAIKSDVKETYESALAFYGGFFQEFDRGTITLTVIDQNGNTATATRNFPFDGSSPNRTDGNK